MKKLTSLILALILCLGIMIPAQAADSTEPATEASTQATSEPSSATAAEPAAIPQENHVTWGLEQQRLFFTLTFILQMRETLDIEKELGSIVKSVDGLEANVDAIQLTSSQLLAMFFYSIENMAEIAVEGDGTAYTYSWLYKPQEGSELHIYLNPEGLVWSLTTAKNMKAISVK